MQLLDNFREISFHGFFLCRKSKSISFCLRMLNSASLWFMNVKIRVRVNILICKYFIWTELSGITSPIVMVQSIACSENQTQWKLQLKYIYTKLNKFYSKIFKEAGASWLLRGGLILCISTLSVCFVSTLLHLLRTLKLLKIY